MEKNGINGQEGITKDFEINGEVVPWFPRKISELDVYAHRVLTYGKDLDADHPGFKDATYRKRREKLGEIALNYKHGQPIPKISYTEEEIKTWNAVFTLLSDLFPTHACREFNESWKLMKEECGYRLGNIPQLEDVSNFLKEKSGFTLRPVAGMIAPRDFLAGLAFRVFHCTQYLRHSSDPLYTPEPDLCHELCGHMPMLADPVFAQFSQTIGLASLGVSDDWITKLAQLYLYTVEFGLVKEENDIKVFGAGALSSADELKHCISKEAVRKPFKAEETCLQSYSITTFQNHYYVCESIASAMEELRNFVAKIPRPFSVVYHGKKKSVEIVDANGVEIILENTNNTKLMDANKVRRMGSDMLECIANYIKNIHDMPVVPNVKPGFLLQQLPSSPPEEGESWENIYSDVNNLILPGSVQWNSRHFHALFPSVASPPSFVGEMLCAAIGGVGFTWSVNPAMTELEIVVMDWFGKMLQLPKEFLHSNKQKGGGSIQGTASEALLVTMLAARSAALEQMKKSNPDVEDHALMSKLVAYASDQVHSSFEKDCVISCVKFKLLPSDKDGSLRASALQKAIKDDKASGLEPFFLCVTLGSTPSCAFDDLEGLGPVCNQAGLWLHIDAAYAGSAFICPELRPLLNGVEHAQSFNCNPTKFFLTNMDCSCLWVKDRDLISQGFGIQQRTYYFEDETGIVTDFKNWHIPLGRRFRSLKLWFIMRHYGVTGMQSYLRKSIKLAKYFESLVRKDKRFEIVAKTTLALVSFRYKASTEVNRAIIEKVNASGKIYITPATVHGRYFIRFSVGHPDNTEADVDYAWDVIRQYSSEFEIITNGES